MKKIFIDGSAGTTGLRIFERLQKRSDIELILLGDEERKNPSARKSAINQSDITFLCLPDDAARESVSFVENEHTVIIDTSTAHRTSPSFAYGFPELSSSHFEKIKNSNRIAVPGCHASGFIALIYPLTETGIINKNAKLSCFSLTGYSGGGKKMIAEYESKTRDPLFDSPRQYGILQSHKHLPEMKVMTGIDNEPVFCPIVGDFYSGMEVTVPIFASDLNGTVKDIKDVYSSKYNSSIVKFSENADENGFMASNKLSGLDSMEISVTGNDDRILLVARYDNLGKGASGAAIECMNIVMNTELTTGLNI